MLNSNFNRRIVKSRFLSGKNTLPLKKKLFVFLFLVSTLTIGNLKSYAQTEYYRIDNTFGTSCGYTQSGNFPGYTYGGGGRILNLADGSSISVANMSQDNN